MDEAFRSEAEYELERAAVCPNCKEDIDALQVIRMLRKRVNFTSTLPRRGRAIVCPKCSALFSIELGAFS